MNDHEKDYIRSINESRVVINNLDDGVIQADGIGVFLLDAGVAVQPAENLLVPDETVFLADDPVFGNWLAGEFINMWWG